MDDIKSSCSPLLFVDVNNDDCCSSCKKSKRKSSNDTTLSVCNGEHSNNSKCLIQNAKRLCVPYCIRTARLGCL